MRGCYRFVCVESGGFSLCLACSSTLTFVYQNLYFSAFAMLDFWLIKMLIVQSEVNTSISDLGFDQACS